MLRLAVGLMAVVASMATAEELPSLADALSQIEGQEVHIDGKLMKYTEESGAYYVEGSGSTFPLDFAIPRETLREVFACLDAHLTVGCRAELRAEIKRNGASLGLLVFDIETPLAPIQ